MKMTESVDLLIIFCSPLNFVFSKQNLKTLKAILLASQGKNLKSNHTKEVRHCTLSVSSEELLRHYIKPSLNSTVCKEASVSEQINPRTLCLYSVSVSDLFH